MAGSEVARGFRGGACQSDADVTGRRRDGIGVNPVTMDGALCSERGKHVRGMGEYVETVGIQ